MNRCSVVLRTIAAAQDMANGFTATILCWARADRSQLMFGDHSESMSVPGCGHRSILGPFCAEVLFQDRGRACISSAPAIKNQSNGLSIKPTRGAPTLLGKAEEFV